MNNVSFLSNMDMKTGEALESYMQHIRNAVDLLRGGKIHIQPILITLIAVCDLDSSYKAVKYDLSIQSDKYTNLDLETLETRCKTFASATKTVQSDAATPTAAATKVATNTRSCALGTSTSKPSDSKPSYPPRIPRYDSVVTQLAKGATDCPVCFIRHPVEKCGRALQAGYIIEYNPNEAKAKFDALDLKKHNPCNKQTGKPHTSISASAPLPALPPPPTPQAPPSPPSPPLDSE